MVACEPGPHRPTPFLTLYSSLPGGLKGVLSCQDNQEHGRAVTQTLRVVEAHAGVRKPIRPVRLENGLVLALLTHLLLDFLTNQSYFLLRVPWRFREQEENLPSHLRISLGQLTFFSLYSSLRLMISRTFTRFTNARGT